jgi:hypothetical protein
MPRLTKIVLCLLVGLVLFLPAIERVDFWDNLPATGEDLELTEISLLVLVGFTLCFRLVRLVIQLVLFALHVNIAAFAEEVSHPTCPLRFRSAFPHDLPNPALSLRI